MPYLGGGVVPFLHEKRYEKRARVAPLTCFVDLVTMGVYSQSHLTAEKFTSSSR